jgi:simple sugar transport system permease protein
MFRLELRAAPSRTMTIASPLIALFITALVAAVIFAGMGKDPVAGLRVIFIDPIGSRRQIAEVLLKATPLIIIALGLAVCYRANVWNIGAEGQFLLGCLTGGGVALWLTTQGVVLPRVIGIPLVLIAGMLGGMLWAGLVALLRDRFNMPQSASFHASLHLPALLERTRLHVGFLVALLLALVLLLFQSRTFRGFQLQVGGLAPAAASYGGFSARSALWTSLLLSGALAGLAGAMEVAGPIRHVSPYLSTGLGFTAIIVCFVGRLHPLGIIAGGVLLSLMLIGGELAQSRMGLPNAMASVLQGLLLLVLLGCDTFIDQRLRWNFRRRSAA